MLIRWRSLSSAHAHTQNRVSAALRCYAAIFAHQRAFPQSIIYRPNSCKHDLSGKCALAELLYNNTHHPAVAIVDNLLHGFLEFDLTLLVYHGYLACNAVIY